MIELNNDNMFNEDGTLTEYATIILSQLPQEVANVAYDFMTEPEQEEQPITNPYYHKGDVECIDIIKVFTKDLPPNHIFPLGNIIKYLFRYNKKGGLQDLHKAKTYLQMLIEEYHIDETN